MDERCLSGRSELVGFVLVCDLGSVGWRVVRER